MGIKVDALSDQVPFQPVDQGRVLLPTIPGGESVTMKLVELRRRLFGLCLESGEQCPVLRSSAIPLNGLKLLVCQELLGVGFAHPFIQVAGCRIELRRLFLQRVKLREIHDHPSFWLRAMSAARGVQTSAGSGRTAVLGDCLCCRKAPTRDYRSYWRKSTG